MRLCTRLPQTDGIDARGGHLLCVLFRRRHDGHGGRECNLRGWAAAFIINGKSAAPGLKPTIVDFESYVDSKHIDKVGFEHRDDKLRIILAHAVRDLAGPMIEGAVDALLTRNGLRRADIRFWVAHPGGRKVIDNVQRHLGLTDEQLRFSRAVLRNYGNMSSPTVMFVLDEVIRTGNTELGDLGVMVALGPGMAAEAALLKW
jgi:alkylresorcinol/alkylpyrone synthase